VSEDILNQLYSTGFAPNALKLLPPGAKWLLFLVWAY